jgi:hypothetical protein
MTEDQALIPSIGVLPSGGCIVSNPDFHLSSTESKQTKRCTNEGNPGLSGHTQRSVETKENR